MGLGSRSMTEEHQRAPESGGLRASLAKRVARKSARCRCEAGWEAIRPAVAACSRYAGLLSSVQE
ncbi:hypothetical protein Save01_06773 [Streptomyces avermitilis]